MTYGAYSKPRDIQHQLVFKSRKLRHVVRGKVTTKLTLTATSLVGAVGFMLAIMPFSYYTALGLITSYSYWYDELWSVVVSNADLLRVFDVTINDVHPPLYQLILWVWMKPFGDAESATRALSATFTVASFGVLASLRHSLGWGTTLLVLAFYIAHPHTAFYAQETRSYSALALFSCMCMVGLVNGNRPLVYVAAVLLGLTHSFGALLGALSLVCLVWMRPTRASLTWAVVVFAIIAAWPAAQLLAGSLSNLTGGNFWITTGPRAAGVMGVRATWPGLTEAVLQGMTALGVNPSRPAETSAIAVLLALAGIIFLHLRNKHEGARALVIASAIIVGVLLAVPTISFHTPIATPRNFIILAPFGALVLAILASRALSGATWIRGLAILVCCAYAFAVLAQSVTRMEKKIHTAFPYREMLKQAERIAIEEGLPIYYPFDRYDDLDAFNDNLFGFYLSNDTSIETLPPAGATAEMPPDFVVIFLNKRCAELFVETEHLEQTHNMAVIAGVLNDSCNYSSGALRFQGHQ